MSNSSSSSSNSNSGSSSYQAPDDDPIVATVPVFLSQDLMNELYLCQYPLRPAGRPYDSDMGKLVGVRVKPKARMVEMDYELDQKNDNFDEHADEPISHFRLSSTAVPPKTNYAVGVLREGQLHLTPLHAVVRMRPNFEYIDHRKAMERMRDNFLSMDDQERAEAVEQAQEMKPVMVKMKKKETERSAAYRKQSHHHHVTQINAEPWIAMTPHSKDSDESRAQFEKLIAQAAEPIDFNIAARDYLAYINPAPSAATAGTALGSGDVTAASSSRMTQNKLPVGDQALKLLASARVLSFGTLMQQTGASTEPAVQELLSTLETGAHLIQGNWVAKSELPPGRHLLARNYVMTQFWRNRVLQRESLRDLLKLDTETMDQIFEEFAVRLPNRRGWEFKQPTDDKFMKTFSGVMRSQNSDLEAMESRNKWQLQQTYSTTAEPSVSLFESKRLSAAMSLSAIPPSSLSHSSASNSSSSSSSIGSASSSFGLAPLTDVDSLASSSSSSSSSSAPPNKSILQQQLTTFLHDLFKVYGMCSYSFINQRLEKEREKKVDGSFLADVSDSVLTSTLAQIGMQIGKLWCRKSLNNEQADKFRSVIASVFATKSKVKKSDVVQAVHNTLNEEVPEQMYTNLMKEFAVFDKSKNTWVLKTGNYVTGADS